MSRYRIEQQIRGGNWVNVAKSYDSESIVEHLICSLMNDLMSPRTHRVEVNGSDTFTNETNINIYKDGTEIRRICYRIKTSDIQLYELQELFDYYK